MQQVFCIQYLINFPKAQLEKIQAIIDSVSKINAMTLVYANWLSLEIRPTNVCTQKIDDLALKIYGMVIAGFLVHNKLGKVQFFKETFILIDTNMEMVLEMLFLSLSNVNVKFTEVKRLIWRTYTIVEAISTI